MFVVLRGHSRGHADFQTGGASGIARATAELFSQNHYKVVIADRSVALGQEVVKNLKANGEEAAFVELDVAKEESVQNCVDFAVKTFGGLDCAVNAAGITGPFCPAQETPLEGWQQKLNIDLTGCLMFTKACVNYWLTQEPRTLRDDAELGLPPVTQRGALVNVASFNGLYASKNMVSHGMSMFSREGTLTDITVAAKHGVNGISKTFAYELATQGIRVRHHSSYLIEGAHL